MIEAQSWVAAALSGLKKTFGPRLLYVGLQGSYRRGEAGETSDIDLVVVLDKVEPEDLDAYRNIVRTLPEGYKACGFVCEAGVLTRWPRHELFSFQMDCDDHYGRLDDFLPPLVREDAREGLRAGCSALLHLLTHTCLFADAGAKPAVLKEAYKSAYFVMQLAHYLDTGVYCRSKGELLARLDGGEKEIVAAGRDFSAWLAARGEREAFGLLYGWCRRVMNGL